MLLPSTGGYSARAKTTAEKKATATEAKATEFANAAVELADQTFAVVQSRAALAAHLGSVASAAASDPTKKYGALSSLLKTALTDKGISVQRYWSGQLVGPDCRKFLKHFPAILAIARDEIAKTHGPEEAHKWYDLTCAVLKEIDVVSHFSRAARFLNDDELDKFEAACRGFGVAYRAAHPEHPILTIKGHLIEMHLATIARRYRTLGMFGEDGLEALHPLDTRARMLVRSMRNALARHMALAKHETIQQNFEAKPKEGKQWKRTRGSQDSPVLV